MDPEQYIQFHLVLDVIKLIVPPIIIIGLMVWFYGRAGGSTFQKDLLLESKRAADATEETARQLARIATALEQRNP